MATKRDDFSAVGRRLRKGLLFSTCALALYGGASYYRSTSLPSSPLLLRMNMRQGFEEVSGRDLWSGFQEYDLSVHDIVYGLRKAAEDSQVKGLFADVGNLQSRGGPFSMATAQEVREALKYFNSTGKTSVCHADSFPVFDGSVDYYLATGFKGISVQPTGFVGLTGLSLSMPFLSGTMKKLRVHPLTVRREQYKSATEILTETKFSPAARENIGALLSSLFSQMVDGIAESRGMNKEQVKTLIDKGPFTAKEAKEHGLIDALQYTLSAHDSTKQVVLQNRGDKNAALKAESSDNIHVLSFRKYVKAKRKEDQWKEVKQRIREALGLSRTTTKKVALIYGLGTVDSGLGIDHSLSADTFCKSLRKAVKDKDVEAIVLRINSEGGSSIAADTIWNEVQQARRQGKKVYASIGNCAASGGYYVAMAADKVFAARSSVTGSIGIFSIQFFLRDFLREHLGVTTDSIAVGKHATFGSPLGDVPSAGSEEMNKVKAIVDIGYQEFVDKVALSRNLSVEKLSQLAGGRVFTGEEAVKNGLVDAEGGLHEAIEEAKRWIEREKGHRAKVETIAQPKSALTALRHLLSGVSSAEEQEEEEAEVNGTTTPRRQQTTSSSTTTAATALALWDPSGAFFIDSLMRELQFQRRVRDRLAAAASSSPPLSSSSFSPSLSSSSSPSSSLLRSKEQQGW
ncbi:Periplasmic serine protease ClpP class protein [Balamuthia mandrillaris]